jgi:hypothetical protein
MCARAPGDAESYPTGVERGGQVQHPGPQVTGGSQPGDGEGFGRFCNQGHPYQPQPVETVGQRTRQQRQ